jgi:alginate O-acetyltransferase complex protein AlgI
MNFTSSIFVAFCACFYPAYFLVARNVRWRNRLILGASYLFYGWWDWRFLFLILLTCTIDYKVAHWIEDHPEPRLRKRFLWVSLASNLGVLGLFKYFNFFADSLNWAFERAGLHGHITILRLILPVGISFYTFQSLAYVFDVYWGKVRAERDPNVFYPYVAYFPQLAAGPIERAEHMLPQFREVRLPTASDIRDGIWLIIYGFFTKMVVADTLAPWVNLNFQATQQHGWSTILATIGFGLQIYGDFKGYSLVAKGLASLMGFQLMWNFSFPYWSTSIQEFWRRWHISLSTWLRDYLYIPLGGSRATPLGVCRNIMITMLLGGLWHGAGWNFLIWGAWHGLALSFNFLFRKSGPGAMAPVLGRFLTLATVFVGWFFFRAETYPTWMGMLGSLRHLEWLGVHTAMLRVICLLLIPAGLLEYVEFRSGQNQLTFARSQPWLAALIEVGLLLAIFAVSERTAVSFIYFQF